MIAEQRHQAILDIVNREQTATVQMLAQEMNISESTIRRDLVTLDAQGQLHRVHGGAACLRFPQRASTQEPDMSTKEALFPQEKQAIGRCAAAMIEANDFVFIDAGSTTMQLVEAISGEALKATYVTNGLAHTRALARKGCTVYVPAGRIKPTTEAIIGATVLHSLQRYNFTKAFMGANGIDLNRGFTTPGIEEAELKAAAIANAYESWVLTDHSKFGVICGAGICELSACNIITDHLPDGAYRDYTWVKEAELT